jgi:membrane protease YdiL (CAAX protease family)
LVILAQLLGEEGTGQLLVIALPEEMFYRGYLQPRLERVLPPRFNVLGARVGLAVVITSAIFAVGHLATALHPSRLAVFFPSLLFGWLAKRSGGVGAAVVFHAACNLFASYLARSYAL